MSQRRRILCDPSTSDHAGRVGASQLRSVHHSRLHPHGRALRGTSIVLPTSLGPEQIRQYQAAMFRIWKLAPNTITQRLAALRFLYIQVLKRGWSVAENTVSEEGTTSSGDYQPAGSSTSDRCHGDSLPAPAGLDALCHGNTPGRSCSPDGERYRQPADGGSHPRRQGPQGSRRDAESGVARRTAHLLARATAHEMSEICTGKRFYSCNFIDCVHSLSYDTQQSLLLHCPELPKQDLGAPAQAFFNLVWLPHPSAFPNLL